MEKKKRSRRAGRVLRRCFGFQSSVENVAGSVLSVCSSVEMKCGLRVCGEADYVNICNAAISAATILRCALLFHK
ncbi:hypothetical protein JOB18_048566 [Solea senegalensis]|uniref:Uncharacterized protein n=1 Tax=Solea senegalensis TaxID=28829 RepID=A0AAV6PZA4_SOLSE|nr:hypothetical protein JOB18_048566 [Solea senegalensis]